MIEESLDLWGTELVGALDSLEQLAEDYVLFGSVVLYLNGIDTGRPVGDIDVFVSRPIWGTLLARPDWRVLTPRVGDPPLLEYPAAPPIHVFYAWTHRDREWMSVERCLDLAELVGGFRCIPLDEVRRHKRLAGTVGRDAATRAKHARDLALLDSRLGPR